MYENYSRLRMKAPERCQWGRSIFFFVNCEHISNFDLIVDFAGFVLTRQRLLKKRSGLSFALYCNSLSVNKIY